MNTYEILYILLGLSLGILLTYLALITYPISYMMGVFMFLVVVPFFLNAYLNKKS